MLWVLKGTVCDASAGRDMTRDVSDSYKEVRQRVERASATSSQA